MMLLMVESFNVPAMYVVNLAVSSLFTVRHMTGIVMDTRDGVSHTCPAALVRVFIVPVCMWRTGLFGVRLL